MNRVALNAMNQHAPGILIVEGFADRCAKNAENEAVPEAERVLYRRVAEVCQREARIARAHAARSPK